MGHHVIVTNDARQPPKHMIRIIPLYSTYSTPLFGIHHVQAV